MLDKNDFDIILNKGFINSYDFYKDVIEKWYCEVLDRTYKNIAIFTDDIEIVCFSIENYCQSYNIKYKVIKVSKTSRNIILKLSDTRTLYIHIANLDYLSSNLRGMRCYGVIIDVKNKKELNQYFDDRENVIKLFLLLCGSHRKDSLGLILYC